MRALLIGLVILAVVFGMVERLWPAIPGQRRLRPGFRTDLAYWFVTPVITRAAADGALLLALVVAAVVMGAPRDPVGLREHIQRSPTWFTAQPLGVQIVMGMLLADLAGYWQHRLFHRGWLWKLHAIHHSSRQLDWLAAVRLHPLNDVIGKVLSVLPLFLIGLRPLAAGAFLPVSVLYAILLHANVRWTYGPLRYVIASPAFHR